MAVEMQPGLLRLRAAIGDTVGANVDPSHLLWMGADPIAAIDALASTIHHVHAKDTRIEDRAAVTSRLETIPNERPDERAWNYVAVGTGHPDGVAFWARFVDALAARRARRSTVDRERGLHARPAGVCRAGHRHPAPHPRPDRSVMQH